MKVINSTVKKDKKANLISYSFDINNEHFIANYIYGKKPRFELFHNNSLIGSSEQIKNKMEFSVNSEMEILNIVIWLEYNNYNAFFGKLNGVGIELNGNPIQNTLADPDVYINNGRGGFFILMFILLVKSIFTYYQIFKEYSSHIISGISSSIYLIPLIIVILFTIIYKKCTMVALIIGSIILSLEFIDYILGVPNTLMAGSGSNAVSLIIWLAIRVSGFIMFYNAFKWYKKRKSLNIK